MRIAIDGHSIGTNTGGNEVYIRNLLETLSHLDTHNEYIIYVNPGISLDGLPPNYKTISITSNRLFRPVHLSFRLKKDTPDIYHGQYFLPPLCNTASAVTVHDTSPISNPEWFTKKERLIFKFLGNSIKKADKIITVSEFSKHELLEHFMVDQKKISVIYNGVNEIFKPDTEKIFSAGIKTKYSLPDDYILCVSRFNSRKNISLLIKAFSIFKKNNKNNIKLILVGANDGKSENLKALADSLCITSEVIFPGYIAYSDLPAIYASAALFVFPSFYEGFGIPPLEAMACGIPVIVSDIPVFSELLGDSAIKIDPHSEENLASAMEKVIFDGNLRENLINRGIKTAEKFKWQKTAEKTLELYKEII
ncbi:MAG: glycosyltransferase family 4 protein [Candidatus Omnitrophica bacterium]|nr:glycosyltransferase family 4 protein [Candidatus Omnitrophota bacterium]